MRRERPAAANRFRRAPRSTLWRSPCDLQRQTVVEIRCYQRTVVFGAAQRVRCDEQRESKMDEDDKQYVSRKIVDEEGAEMARVLSEDLKQPDDEIAPQTTRWFN